MYAVTWTLKHATRINVENRHRAPTVLHIMHLSIFGTQFIVASILPSYSTLFKIIDSFVISKKKMMV